ncbi:MAG: hypothetical protein JKY60_09710 [Kordiimonadaceae bacterium]|nr:hypothetical protein [Kordiimonadaceae bacterium]
MTAVSPIEYRKDDPDGRVAEIRQALLDHEQGNSLFRACPMVHTARLQILDQLTPPMGDVSGAGLKTKYLLFAVNIDGCIDDFLDCLYRADANFVLAVWGRCLGYPTYRGAVFFRRYISRCLFKKPLGYDAFPASVEDTLRVLTRKQALASWVASHQGMNDAELKEAWSRDRDRFINPDLPTPGGF